MTITTIKAKAYRLTNTNSSTFLNGVTADILTELNTQYGHRILDILKVQVDRNASQEEATIDFNSLTGLTAGELGFNGEYPFPSNFLKPVRVEISYDGTTWTPAKFYDVYENESSESVADSIAGAFSEGEPYVRFDRDSFFVRPLNTGSTTIDNGIRVWYEKRQTALTESTPPSLEDFGGFLLKEDGDYLLLEDGGKIVLEETAYSTIDRPTTVTADYTSPTFEENLHDILAYDLAYQEILMHDFKYNNNFVNRFEVERDRVKERFMEFYKNRFKRNGNLKIRYNHSNINYN